MDIKCMDTGLRLALLKESAKYRDFWKKNGTNISSSVTEINQFAKDPTYKCDESSPLTRLSCQKKCRISKACHSLSRFFDMLQEHFEFLAFENFEKIFPHLDPYNEEELPEYLFIKFTDRLPPITQVVIDREAPREFHYATLWEANRRLAPHERMFIIDLTRRKGEIIQNFTSYLNNVEEDRKQEEYNPWAENYAKWQPETDRQRNKETWQALKVWKLRRKRKSFEQIRKETNSNNSTVKDQFYRAYELIEGQKYNHEQFRDFYKETKIEELKRICRTCTERSQCEKTGILCPDTLAYYKQDDVDRREKLLPSLYRDSIHLTLPPLAG